jgi:uncharacterized protein (DUF924 family)
MRLKLNHAYGLANAASATIIERMSPQTEPDPAKSLLDFWFGAPGTPEHDHPRDVWFKTNPTFDAILHERFSRDHERAAAGEYAHWQGSPERCLALTLLFDQLPRNLFRGSARAYATDGQARAVARHAVEHGFDRASAPVRRWFFYLPFEHSEDLADQERSLELYASLPEGKDRDWCLYSARRHHEIIARFGRFPHRNRALGRVSTSVEEAFLREPNSSF